MSTGFKLACLCVALREMISYATLKMKEDGTLHRLETKWWYEKGECGSDAGHRVRHTLRTVGISRGTLPYLTVVT